MSSTHLKPTIAAAVLWLCIVVGVGSAWAQAGVEAGIRQYREMLSADPWANPGHLDVDRGAELWRTPSGPARVSMEGCDLGLGRGVVEGAFAQLPRYFTDAGRVMDLEARLIWCMERLQGSARAELLREPHPVSGQPVKDLGAIATFVASRSAGDAIAPRLGHPREREALKLGEALFHRRQGPMDFSCAGCHSGEAKRIRLQELAQLTSPDGARAVIGAWPAYRVSSAHTMTMQHRLYDCFWQMRLPAVEIGSEATVALVMYLSRQAAGGKVAVPGLKR